MESPEIIELVEKAKAGDDLAFEKLFFKYTDLISGQRMATSMGFHPNKGVVDEDYKSLCQVLFVEAIYKYDPTKSKLSTYLVNYIRWSFMQRYLGERLVRINRRSTVEETNDLLDKTTVIPTLDVEKNESGHEGVFELGHKDSGQSFIVNKDCLSATLVGFLSEQDDRSKKLVPLFEKYLEGMIDNGLSHRNAIKFAATETKTNNFAAAKAIIKASNYLKKNITISEARIQLGNKETRND